jgi:hypothetical protein
VPPPAQLYTNQFVGSVKLTDAEREQVEQRSEHDFQFVFPGPRSSWALSPRRASMPGGNLPRQLPQGA